MEVRELEKELHDEAIRGVGECGEEIYSTVMNNIKKEKKVTFSTASWVVFTNDWKK